MFAVVWILFGLFCSGTGLNHHTRHERTRYVSSRNQIYGGNFAFDEKYIPFVHFWEKPLQVLESSMKIPKKLSSRPLFSWDIPPAISTYTLSRKTSTTENYMKPTVETLATSKEPKSPNADSNAISHVPKGIQKSHSDRAKMSAKFPNSLALIPIKKKKSGNRKKSIEESGKWKEFVEGAKTSVKVDSNGRLKKKKKVKKNRKGQLEKISRKRTGITGKIKEMNDQVNELNLQAPEHLEKEKILKIPKVRSPCDMLEEKCDHRCEEVNGKAVCTCFRGFTPKSNKCVDVNECQTNNGGCNGKCVNTIGSRKCICSAGYRLVDGVCADINECLLRNGHGTCQDQCTNTIGSYYCSCDGLPGTTLSSNKHTCEYAQNCNVSSAGCSHTCITVPGRTFCTCPDGLELGHDWKTCHDIDECSNPEDYDVHCEFGCVNTLGSYTCASPTEGNSS